MVETEREPCPSCAEPVALEARLCPHCHASTLFDLVLEAPVRDDRVRYQVARALAAHSGRPFMELQPSLARPRPRPLRQLTRRRAREIGAALEPFGVQWTAEPGGAAPRSSGGSGVPLRLALTGGAAALVLGGLLAIWVSRPGSAPGAAPTLAPPEPETPGDAPRAAPGPELSAADRAERALASTVALRCPNALGAGFFVAPDLVLTNAHVAVCDAEMRVVLADGRESGAVVLRRDARLDLAVIRALGLNEPPLPLADAGEVRVGDPVTLIGSPVGMEFTVHEGSVSNLPRMVLGIAYIQLDAKINPGNSGGPLIDRQGRVVGIVSMKRTDAEGIGLALPINYAWDGAGSLIAPPGGRRERSEGFARMVQQVKAEEQKLVTELATAPRQPLLVAAGWDRYQRLVAVVVRISGPTPNAEDVKLRVLDGSRQVCEMSGGVSSWRRLETESEAGSREMAARLEQWLASTGVGAQVYGGEVPLRFDLCRLPRRSGYVLELVGADPRADRLRF